MEFNNPATLIISISLLALALFSGEARDISPSALSSPSQSPASAPKSSPASSPSRSSPATSPVSASKSSPASSPAPSPATDSAPPEAGQKDVVGVIGTFINSGIADAEGGVQQAQKLISDPSTPAPVKECLKQCVEKLQLSADDLSRAKDNVAAGIDDMAVDEDVAEASKDAAGCEQCFQEMVGDNPVEGYESAVKDAASNVLGLVGFTS